MQLHQLDLIYCLSITDLTSQEVELAVGMLSYLEVAALEELDTSINVFQEEEEKTKLLREELLSLCPWLSKEQLTIYSLPNENWNKSWESSFDPILIDHFCTIKATFHQQELPSTKHVITIDPEMAFGTGHHETTYSMIQTMEDVSFSNLKVFDYGSGTAILAILAEQLGASSVYALDYDPIATECGEKCVSLNKAKNITCATGEISDLSESGFDIILANINRNVLLQNVQHVKNNHKLKGTLLLSGILEQDKSLVVDSYEKVGYQLQQTVQKGNWLCLKFVLIG